MAKETKSQKDARLKKEKAAKEAAEKKKQDNMQTDDDEGKNKKPLVDAFGNVVEGIQDSTGFDGGVGSEPNPYKDLDLVEFVEEPDRDCYKNCQEKDDVKNINCKMLKDAFIADMKARGCKVVVTQKSTKKTCRSSKSGKKSKAKYAPTVYQYTPPPVMSTSCGCKM